MHKAIIDNLSRPLDRPLTVQYCNSFFCRLRGLTFRGNLPMDQGLLLVQDRDSRLETAIHMLFVFMDLAVIWINSNQEVVDVRLARRWRLAYLPKHSARFVLELNAECLNDFNVGDQVKIEKN